MNVVARPPVPGTVTVDEANRFVRASGVEQLNVRSDRTPGRILLARRAAGSSIEFAAKVQGNASRVADITVGSVVPVISGMVALMGCLV